MSTSRVYKVIRQRFGKMAGGVLVLFLVILFLNAGCSIKKFAINKIGDTLVSGNSVYESNEELELVAGALPFGLKLVESLLAESPHHRGLLLTACQGFVLYSSDSHLGSRCWNHRLSTGGKLAAGADRTRSG